LTHRALLLEAVLLDYQGVFVIRHTGALIAISMSRAKMANPS
jgi:hypothetical protein